MKVLIVGMPGAGNLGDDLISSIIVKELIKAEPSLEVGVLIYGDKNLFGYPLSTKLLEYPVRRNPVKYLNRRKSIKLFLRDTALIVIGGGGLLQDSHSYFTVHKYLKYMFYYPSQNQKVILAGVGIGPIRYSLTKHYLKVTGNRITTAYLRDKESIELGSSFFSNITQIPDIVEGCDVEAYGFKATSTRDRALGCSIRPWKGLAVETITDLIAKICAENQYACRLFVFEYTAYNREEYEFALLLKTMLVDRDIETTIYTYGETPIAEFQKSFCSVEKAVAIRFHANILWQKVGVPVLPISYAPKVTSLYKKAGIDAISIESLQRDMPVLVNQSFYHVPVSEPIDMKRLITTHDNGVNNKPWWTLMLVTGMSLADHLYGIYYSIKIRIVR